MTNFLVASFFFLKMTKHSEANRVKIKINVFDAKLRFALSEPFLAKFESKKMKIGHCES